MVKATDSAFKSISILYRKSHIWLNEGCAQFGLTAAQALVISIVCDFNLLTQDEITKLLGLDKSVVAKTVMKLTELDFLVRTTNAKDKRTYDIHPTDAAWQVYPAIKEQVELCFEKMTTAMKKSERAEFRRLLVLAAQSVVDQEDGHDA